MKTAIRNIIKVVRNSLFAGAPTIKGLFERESVETARERLEQHQELLLRIAQRDKRIVTVASTVMICAVLILIPIIFYAWLTKPPVP